MTEPNRTELREKVAETIYHFVHRGHANYMSWKELPYKYGKKSCYEVADQILAIFPDKEENVELTPDTRPELGEKIAHIKLADDEGITVEGVPRYIESGAINLILVEQALEFANQILALCEKEMRERIISQIEQMDKRHTVSFVLQILRGEVKE